MSDGIPAEVLEKLWSVLRDWYESDLSSIEEGTGQFLAVLAEAGYLRTPGTVEMPTSAVEDAVEGLEERRRFYAGYWEWDNKTGNRTHAEEMSRRMGIVERALTALQPGDIDPLPEDGR